MKEITYYSKNKHLDSIIIECLCVIANRLNETTSPNEQIEILKAKPGLIEFIAEEQLHYSVKFMLL